MGSAPNGIFPRNGIEPRLAGPGALESADATCEELFYRTDCRPQIDIQSLNTLISEIVAAVNCSGVPYDCDRLDNLCRAIERIADRDDERLVQVRQGSQPGEIEYVVNDKNPDTAATVLSYFLRASNTLFNDSDWFLGEADTVQQALDQLSDFLKNAFGDMFFNNPVFYVTDGAPPPNTDEFTEAGNTESNAFGSMADAIDFISTAYIFGVITFDIDGIVHNLNLFPRAVKGAASVTLRPRNEDADNLIVDYCKTSSSPSSGITAADGLTVDIQTGFTSRSFGIGYTPIFNGCINAANEGRVNILLDGDKPNSFIRHTGLHPENSGGLMSAIYVTDGGGSIRIRGQAENKNDAPKEYFNLDSVTSATQYFNHLVRVGDDVSIDFLGFDRVYEKDLHVYNDFDKSDDGGARMRYAGGIAGVPYAHVLGPGNCVIHSSYPIIILSSSLTLECSNSSGSIGSSVEDYQAALRYESANGALLETYGYKDSYIRFTKQGNVTDSDGTYGTFFGTEGNDLPAGA